MGTSNNKAVNEMVDLFRDVVSQEIKKEDSTVLCKITEKLGSNRYNLSIVPDDAVAIRNIPNMTKFSPKIGDYVYVYKINNQLSNAFICCVLGETLEETESTSVQAISSSQTGTVTPGSSSAYVIEDVLHL